MKNVTTAVHALNKVLREVLEETPAPSCEEYASQLFVDFYGEEASYKEPEWCMLV